MRNAIVTAMLLMLVGTSAHAADVVNPSASSNDTDLYTVRAVSPQTPTAAMHLEPVQVRVEARETAETAEITSTAAQPRNFWWTVGAIVLAGLILVAII